MTNKEIEKNIANCPAVKNLSFSMCPSCKKDKRIVVSHVVTEKVNNKIFGFNFKSTLSSDLSYYFWCIECGDKSDCFSNEEEFLDMLKSEALLKQILEGSSGCGDCGDCECKKKNEDNEHKKEVKLTPSLSLEVKKSKDNRYYVSMFCSYNHQRLMTSQMFRSKKSAEALENKIELLVKEYFKDLNTTNREHCIETSISNSKNGRFFVSLFCKEDSNKLLTSQMYKQRRSATNLKNKIDKYINENWKQ